MNDQVYTQGYITSKGDRDGFHLHPTSYRIEKLDLFPATAKLGDPPQLGIPYDLRPQIKNIVITEGITRSAVHVNLGIEDAIGLLDTLRIQGGEKIDLHIQQRIKYTEQMCKAPQEDLKKNIILELYISDIKDLQKKNIDTSTYILECITEPAYINQLTILNKSFHGTPAKLIKDIAFGLGIPADEFEKFAPNDPPMSAIFGKMKEDSRGAGKEESGYGKEIKGIYPRMRPFAAISWLLRNANDNGTPVFFFQSVLHGYQLKSWEDFHAPENEPYSGVFHPYTDSPIHEEGKRSTVEDLDYYDKERRKIISVNSNLGFSKFNDAKKGAYASSLTAVDLSTKTYRAGKGIGDNKPGKEFTYKDSDMNVRLNKYKPFSSKIKFRDKSFDENKNARNFFVSENDLSFGESNNNYHSTSSLKGIMKREAYVANMDMLTHKIELPGDPTLTAGNKITVQIWKSQDWSRGQDGQIDKFQEKGDELMSGAFLIKSLSHNFAPEGYTMSLEIIKDSSQVDFDEEFTP